MTAKKNVFLVTTSLFWKRALAKDAIPKNFGQGQLLLQSAHPTKRVRKASGLRQWATKPMTPSALRAVRGVSERKLQQTMTKWRSLACAIGIPCARRVTLRKRRALLQPIPTACRAHQVYGNGMEQLTFYQNLRRMSARSTVVVGPVSGSGLRELSQQILIARTASPAGGAR